MSKVFFSDSIYTLFKLKFSKWKSEKESKGLGQFTLDSQKPQKEPLQCISVNK